MTTLAADSPRTYELGTVNEIPVVANDIIYEGSAVGLSSGYARPLVASDTFVGFCEQTVDNTGGAAGAKNVRVIASGLIQLAVTGVAAVTDVGAAVYASDDNTFTTTASTNTYIGAVRRFISSGVALVEFDTPRPPGTVVATALASSAVETAKIANLAVTTAKIDADAVTNAKIADAQISLEHLDTGIAPSHVVKYCGTITWSGSQAALATTVAGVAATDKVVASFLVNPSQAAYIAKVVPTTDTITITLSAANTSNDAQISYVVLRAAA